MTDRWNDATDPGADGEEPVDYQSFIASAADVNIVETPDGVCRYASRACRRVFGWEPADLEGSLLDEFVHPDDLEVRRVARVELPQAEYVSARYRFRRADGSYGWTEVSSHFVTTETLDLVVSSLRDVTERHEYEVELQSRARTDPLTGVANRTVLYDRIEHGLRRLERSNGGLALLYLDLDRFKSVNDSLGHEAGDRILRAVAGRLANHVRPTDTLARPGGDEFVVVVDGATAEVAMDLAARILDAVRGGIRVDGEVFECTISAGVTWTDDPRRTATELVREADQALYRAKLHGRDRVEAFDDELRLSTDDRRSTEQMLRDALEDGRVVVEYQPIIDLRDGHPVCLEALARVRSLDSSLVSPAAFLDVAEESGLLVEIDHLVLADATDRAAGWAGHVNGGGPPRVAVNIGARHLADAAFPRALTGLLERTQLPPGRLQLEVTERTLIESSKAAIAGLRALWSLGVHVALDDFGTGSSSLSSLRQFPLNAVKIDQSLIHDLEREEPPRALVGAVISLGHALDLTVVAEGVETPVQHQVLGDLACDWAQGFLFGRPSSASVAGALLDGLVPDDE